MGLLDRLKHLTTSAGTSPLTPAHTVTLIKDRAGTPAVDLTKLRRDGHIDLAKRADTAGIALQKRGLAGIRAQVVLVLDHSASMHTDYRHGHVQTLVERVLAFAMQVDVDGLVPVIPFDTHVRPDVATTVHTYPGVVDREIWHPQGMGSTNLTAALHTVQTLAADTDQPLLAAIVTDGDPNNKQTATRAVAELSRYPVFLKILAIRDVPYLAQLDDMRADLRLVDNVDTKTFPQPATITDLQFADAMADEWPTWITAATRAGVLA
ncbi:VWA domain-containing protein [Actinoplanes sp. NBRC 101535]|uniref:VWA domain-containing protein n=1 Tax=Actinoplanes sp. NBRC 101535 TaxID=3032196 RepID=UPI0024A0050A|nr:VWA domain-containing protein [Actinoplanes sp. NBRC 101535]GLY08288.1 toxic cation resistance protein [Actinoplanes sp. NBRC 101535]